MKKQFHDVDFGASCSEQAELDAIALRGGCMGSIGYGYATRGSAPEDRHGYGFRWINSQGMGNHGSLVLIPRSKRAAEFIRNGKVSQFMRDFGLDYQDADSLYSVTRGVRRGLEHGVLAYCVATRDCVAAWQHAPDSSWRERTRWEQEWRMPHSDLSCPRWDAVCAIMTAWLRIMPG